MEKYHTEIEQQMRSFFDGLSEKDKRHYAAVEAGKLGYGGQLYIAQLLGCSTRTIQRGQRDLKNKQDIAKGRIRRAGGGRKSYDKKSNKIGRAHV